MAADRGLNESLSWWDKLAEAWRQRGALGANRASRDLTAFLPAALEIQEAPPNPLTKWTARSLMMLFALGIIWACLGRINIVATAEGKIIPSSRIKYIQPLEKAVVQRILVADGQQVEKGEPLIELDDTLTTADEHRLVQQIRSIRLQLAMDRAFLRLLDNKLPAAKAFTKNEIDATLNREIADINSITATRKRQYRTLLTQQWKDYQAQHGVLQSRLEKARAERATVVEQIEKLEQTLPIVTKRSQANKKMYEKNFVSETDYLAVKQERIAQIHDLAAQQQQLRRVDAAVNEILQQIQALHAGMTADKLTEITELQRTIQNLQKELVKARSLNDNQILHAPIAGQVQQLAVSTVGGVVTEAQKLMAIVPAEGPLEVEVFLQNKDIGFVREGMPVEVKIHTFPFTKYGVIDGVITSVSSGAIADEKRGLIYSMRVQMNRNSIRVEGRTVKLLSGMAVTAEARIGERRIIEFFLAPLLRHGQESLRER